LLTPIGKDAALEVQSEVAHDVTTNAAKALDSNATPATKKVSTLVDKLSGKVVSAFAFKIYGTSFRYDFRSVPSLPLARPATSLQGCPITYQIDNPNFNVDSAGTVTPKNPSMEALVGKYKYEITATTLDAASHSTGDLTLTVPCGFIREPSTPSLEQTWLIRPED